MGWGKIDAMNSHPASATEKEIIINNVAFALSFPYG
jgi:hypothetical protein